MAKYTLRMMLNNILNGVITDADKEMARLMIDRLNERAAAAKATPTKAQVENGLVKQNIVNYIRRMSCATAAQLSAALGISTQKASALCRQLTTEGLLIARDTVVNRAKVKNYFIKQ